MTMLSCECSSDLESDSIVNGERYALKNQRFLVRHCG